MSEKMKLEMLAQRIEGQDMEFRTERRFLTDEESDLIVAALRASSPAPEPVTTEPVEQDGPCFYCGEVTSSFAGNPGMWPLIFAQPDGTGIARIHHVHCVTARLAIPAPPQPGRDANDKHYLAAIRHHLKRLYSVYPNNARLRKQISDEIDWIDATLIRESK